MTQSSTRFSATTTNLKWWSVLLAISAAGAALRLWGIGRKWLWWDELLSANFASGDWLSVIGETFRFDPHPPLYYLQLHLWIAIGGASDLWLMLNPLAWSVAGIIGTGWIARRLYGDPSGWLAAALHAVIAASVYKSTYVRMYTMIPSLALWAFWQHRRTARGESTTATQLAALAAEAAIALSHATGFLLLSGIYAFGLFESARCGYWRAWLRWRIPSVAILVPCLIYAFLKRHGGQHPIKPGLEEIARGFHWLVLNPKSATQLFPGDSTPLWIGLATAVWLAWLWLAARDKSALALALLCVLLPATVFALVSHTVRPVWHPRILTVILPFFCLAAAGGATAGPRLPARALACFLVAVMTYSSILGQRCAGKGDDFKPAAAITCSLTLPGDLIVFYGFSWDWFCYSWYHRGPEWGDPLASHSYDMKLPDLLTRLHLTWALPFVIHNEVRQWRAGDALVTAEYFSPVDLSSSPRVIRVISASWFSPLRNRILTPLQGRTLLHSRTAPKGDIRIEVWQ